MSAGGLLMIAAAGAVLALLTVAWLARARLDSPSLLLRVMASAALLFVLLSTVPWPVTSRWLRPLVIALWLAALLRGWMRRGGDRRLLASALLLVVTLPALVVIARGWFPGPTVALATPFGGTGRFAALQAGNNALTNPFHTLGSQPLAADLIALDGWGRRARTLLPRRNEDYVIFGIPIVAACAGEVVAAVDGNGDNVPPRPDRAHVSGNYVAIRCGDDVVFTCHLQSGSVRVRVGQRVAAGEPIARAGNSGNSAEPHLHLEVFRARLDGDKLPFSVDGHIVSTWSTLRGRADTMSP